MNWSFTLLQLFLTGLGLATTQFLLIRELTSILFGEEVVILLVQLLSFTAVSVGYWLSPRLTPRTARLAFLLLLPLHLGHPILLRLLFAFFGELHAPGALRLLATLLLSLLLTVPLATLLPRLIEQHPDPSIGMKQGYTCELLGFGLGLGLVHLCLDQGMTLLIGLHWALLALLLGLVLQRVGGTLVFALTALLLLPGHDDRARSASNAIYEHLHDMPDAKVLFSVDSIYQRVEVVDNGPGRRSLYLDGLENLNSSDLALLNEYIGVVPAALVQPQRTLLIGNGTLSLVPRLSRASERLFSIELDRVVIEAGKLHFRPPASLRDLHNWTPNLGDGKHFLMSTQERFDLIVVDVPSPHNFQEAFLHTREFYELAASRMSPRGVIAVQLSGRRLGSLERAPSRITAALQSAFRYVTVIESDRASRAFAYASQETHFSEEALRDVIPSSETSLEVLTPEMVQRHQEGAAPFTIDSLDWVLLRGWERFSGRYFR